MMQSAVRLARKDAVGWVGLGAMGHPMAVNLFTKTWAASKQSSASQNSAPSFFVCEQSSERVDAFIEDVRQKGGSELAQRITAVTNPKEIAQTSARIVTMLPSTPHVESVYLDEKTGLLAGVSTLSGDQPGLVPEAVTSGSKPSQGSPHTLLIDQTTLDPTMAISVAKTMQERSKGKAVMLDAPVSGGIVAAAAGSLTIMLGSPSPEASALAIPLLKRMAREGGVVECGANGTGVGVKVANNLILAINQIALAEGLALGRSLGIDPKLLHQVVNTSSGQSWSSRVNSPLAEVENSPGSRGYKGGFQSRLMLKDVGLALTAAHKFDLPTPLTWAAKSVYDAVCEEEGGRMATQDFSVVYEWIRKKQEQGVERGWKDGPPEVLKGQ